MISASQLSLFFGQRALFKDTAFFIGKKDRIGLVGKNGAGKSSLLKIIAGLLNASEGQVAIPKGTTIGYLPQEMKHAEENSILEEAGTAFKDVNKLEARAQEISVLLGERQDYQSDSYARLIEELNDINDRLAILETGQTEAKIEKVLNGLGFASSDMHRKMKEFSGGWKMRVELAKILLQNPDLLLLDEPTNHLDIESIEWLEEFLINYPGALLLISHDRTFLDRVTKRTMEISKGKIYDYKFSYSKYVIQREEEFARQLESYKAQQKHIEETERLINKFRAKKNKAAFAQTLIRKLDKMERIDPDELENSSINFRFPPAPRSGKVVIKAKGLSKSFDDLKVFKNVDLLMSRQERIAIVGKNGIGKTTLTRILIGKAEGDGHVELGHNVDVGYYAQDQAEQLDGSKSVFETIDEEAVGDLRTKVRGLLGAFLFRGDDIDKKVRVLSGGEKARLALCKLLLHPYNLLVLDEPTNHLDMQSKDVLKEALMNYDGSLILVSHDRDFLHGLVPLIYEVTANGLKEFRGDIFEFLKDKRAKSIAEFERSKPSTNPSNTTAKKKEESSNGKPQDYKERKEYEREKRKAKNRIERCEKTIEETETKLKELDVVLADLDYSNNEKSEKILAEYAELKKKLDSLYEEWEKAGKANQKFED